MYVAAGPHEVGLWDIEEGKCHQVGGLHLCCACCQAAICTGLALPSGIHLLVRALLEAGPIGAQLHSCHMTRIL